MEAGDKVNEQMGKVFNDMWDLTDSKNWTAGKICGLITSVIILTLFITLTIYCGVYAYSNPDPANAWIIKGVDSTSLTKSAAVDKATAEGITVPEGYPIDMHKVFVAWATWGFWQNLILVCVFLLSLVVSKWSPKVFAIMGTLTALGWLLGSILWLVFGGIWRYSQGGIIASGDKLERGAENTDESWKAALEQASKDNGYQLKSGKFMATIFGMLGGVIFLAIVVCAIAGCLMCCCGMSQDDINKYNMMPQEDKEGDKEQQNEQPIESDHNEELNDQLGLNDSKKPAAQAAH